MRIEWPPITEHVWWLTDYRPAWRDAPWLRMRDAERLPVPLREPVQRLCACGRDGIMQRLQRRVVPPNHQEWCAVVPVVELHYVRLPEALRSAQIDAYLLGRCDACGVVWWRSYAAQDATAHRLTARKPAA